MKSIILILIACILNSCLPSNKCKKSLDTVFDKQFLIIWQRKTVEDIITNGDSKLKYLLESEVNENISIFNRNEFVNNSLRLRSKYKDLRFSELYILEMNYSGEVNRHLKFIIAKCREESFVIRCIFGIKGWDILNTYTVESAVVEKMNNLLLNSKEINGNKYNYWGNTITEVGSITCVKNENQIAVKVFGGLNKQQYDAIDDLNVKN